MGAVIDADAGPWKNLGMASAGHGRREGLRGV